MTDAASLIDRVHGTKRTGPIVKGSVKRVWAKGEPVGQPDERQLEVKLTVKVRESDDITEVERFLADLINAAIE